LLAAWELPSPPAALREEVGRVLSENVPGWALGPIGECLARSRAHDRGAAVAGLSTCLQAVEVDLSAGGLIGPGGLDAALGLAGRRRPVGPKQGAVQSCNMNGAGVDPRLAQSSKAWDFGNWPHSNVAPPDTAEHRDAMKGWAEYQRLEREAQHAWQRYVEALEYEAELDYQVLQGNATQEELEAAKEATEKALEEANKAIEERDAFEPLIVEDDEGTTPADDDGTAVAETLPEVGSPCNAVAEFLANCAGAGWATAPCQIFLERLEGCDTTIMLIDPDQGAACGSVPDEVDAETFDKILDRTCWSRVRPAGPDEDPCAPASIAGAYVVAMQPDPCSDPRALVSPEDGTCVAPAADPGAVTDALLGRSNELGQIVATLEKLCGCDIPPIGGGPAPAPDAASLEVVAWSAEPAWPVPLP
jgi:hypothetical protein